MNVMKCAVFIVHGKVVMYLQSWMLFLWALSLIDKADSILPEDSAVFASDIYEPPSRQNDKFSAAEYPYVKGGNGNKVNYPDDRFGNHYNSGKQHCATRLEDALEQIRRLQDARQKTFDLNGYSVHQQLKSVPYDLYVTDMRVRLPTNYNKWVRVDKCLFNPSNQSLDTRLVFNDLTISGKVNLLDDQQVLRRQEDLDLGNAKTNNRDACNMILRLRKAGIGFHTEPIRRDRGQFNVKTDSHFLEPGFISVYVYGCESKLREREDDEGLSREMEDIFLKGIRSLLMTYMQKELQPAIKETLMRNMGYTVSYG